MDNPVDKKTTDAISGIKFVISKVCPDFIFFFFFSPADMNKQ